MRPPSHPVTARGVSGTLYEPGDHALLFTSFPRETYDVKVLRLPWLLVSGVRPFGDFYVACDAMLFPRDPRPVRRASYVPLASILGNSIANDLLCLGGSPLASEGRDLWNTAFSHPTFADIWTRAVWKHAGDPCAALAPWNEFGRDTAVSDRSVP